MRHLILTLFCVFLISACDTPPTVQSISGHAQGTTYSIKYWSDEPKQSTEEQKVLLKQLADDELARIDKLMSNYRDDSVIEWFNQQTTTHAPIKLPKEILDLLITANEVYEQSQHCYDPTIKPLFKLWGFGKDKLVIPQDAAIDEAVQSIGFNKLQRAADSITKTNPRLTIDLSAIGKGYGVAKVAQVLDKNGIHNYLVEIGGETLTSGTKPEQQPWRVGVEKPIPNSQKVSEVITVTGLRPTAITTSGTYRHYFDDKGQRYSHILSPITGKPITHDTVSVTVILDDVARADAWSTALTCLGSEAGLAIANQQHIAAIFYDLDKDNQLKRLVSDAIKKPSKYWEVKQ